MTAERILRLSQAQHRALVEIRAGRVIYDGMAQRYRSTAWPPAVRAPSIERVIALGLATPTDVASLVALTTAGRAMVPDA